MEKHTYCFYTVTGEHLMFDATMMLELGDIIKLYREVDNSEPEAYVTLYVATLIAWEKVR